MVENGAVALAAEIEIDVLGHVDGRVLVGHGLVFDPPDVVRGQGIGDFHFHFAGEAFLAVRAFRGEDDAHRVAFLEGQGFPDLGVPALDAAVQAAGQAARGVVLGQLVLRAVQGELSSRYAVAEAAHEGAEIGVGGFVAGHVVEAEDAVLKLSLFVGQENARDFAAEIDDVHLDAAGALEGVNVDVLSGTGLRQELRGDVSFRFFHNFSFYLLIIVVAFHGLFGLGLGFVFPRVFAYLAGQKH